MLYYIDNAAVYCHSCTITKSLDIISQGGVKDQHSKLTAVDQCIADLFAPLTIINKLNLILSYLN